MNKHKNLSVEEGHIEKKHYSIEEVLDMIGRDKCYLEEVEKQFPNLVPKIEKKSIRYYTKKEAAGVIQIHFLLIEMGVGFEGVQKSIKNGYYNDMLEFFRKAISKNVKDKMVSKITLYCVCGREKEYDSILCKKCWNALENH